MVLHDHRLASRSLIEPDEIALKPPAHEGERSSPFPGICAALVVLLLLAVAGVAVCVLRGGFRAAPKAFRA